MHNMTAAEIARAMLPPDTVMAIELASELHPGSALSALLEHVIRCGLNTERVAPRELPETVVGDTLLLDDSPFVFSRGELPDIAAAAKRADPYDLPLLVSVGLADSETQAMENCLRAQCLSLDERSEDRETAKLERRISREVNRSGTGHNGAGGISALSVQVEGVGDFCCARLSPWYTGRRKLQSNKE